MNKKNITLMVVAIATLITFVGLATYAYFVGNINTTRTSNVTATTERNNLVFDTNGGAMNLNVSAANMQRAKAGSVAAQNNTTLTVNLTANTDYSMVCTYDIIYEWTSTDKYTTHSSGVSSNEFTIKASLENNSHNNEGSNAIYNETDLSELQYTNNKATVVSGAQIDATGNAMSTAVWTLESKIYNANANQVGLADKNYTGQFKVTNVSCVGGNINGAALSINNACTSGTNLNTCIRNLYSSDGANNLYYHSVGKALSAEDGSYRYAGGVNEYEICGYIPAKYNNGIDGDITCITSDEDIPVVLQTLAEVGLIEMDGYNATVRDGNTYDITNNDDSTAFLYELLEKGYIEQIKDPNNYLCFGANSCNGESDDNLYRIIGVIPVKLSDGKTQNLVKVIKASNANTNILGPNIDSYEGHFAWNHNNADATYAATGAYNIWSYSALNTENLNGYFLNTYLSSTWRNKIANAVWKVGGNTWNVMSGYDSNTHEYNGTAKTAFENEVIHPEVGSYGNGEEEYTAKIGLFYISDYLYASAFDWSQRVVDNHNRYLNWLYNGVHELTITRDSDDNTGIMFLHFDGGMSLENVSFSSYGYNSEVWVRPTFYLNNNVTYVSGDGTIDNPIIVN